MNNPFLFTKQIEQNFINVGQSVAISDFNNGRYTYKDISYAIDQLHSYWESLGLKDGDKIAICGKSSAEWLIVFLAAVSKKYIAVILPEKSSKESIQEFVIHSDCTLLYVDGSLFSHMSFSSMTNLIAVVNLKSNEVLAKRLPNYDKSSGQKGEVKGVAMIFYSSGTSGIKKGVMHSIQTISFMVANAIHYLPYQKGERYFSASPFSHQIGLVYDALATLCSGMTLYIYSLPPAPEMLIPAIKNVSPLFFISVPLIIKKIIDHSLNGSLLSDNNIDDNRKKIMSSFGDKCRFILTGGGPMPKEFESNILMKLKIPVITGYGMTECTTISISSPADFKPLSCGKCIGNVLVRVDNSNSTKEGELLVKSPGMFLGYFDDVVLTKNSFTSDGWFKTGDIGYIDSDNFIYLVGRCKDMLVTSNGLNIFPDEIESKINRFEEVRESLVVQRDDTLIALVYLSDTEMDIDNVIDRLYIVNKELPAYSAISKFEIVHVPFERTEKGTITRYKYK